MHTLSELCIVATVVAIVGSQTVSHIGVFVINACGCQDAGGSSQGKSKKIFARPLILFCSIHRHSFTEVTHFFQRLLPCITSGAKPAGGGGETGSGAHPASSTMVTTGSVYGIKWLAL